MADTKLSALTDVGSLNDSDQLYVVRSGTSYKTTVSSIKATVPYIDGEVQYYGDLPTTVGTPAVGSVYLVKEWQLANPLKFAGTWLRTGNSGALSDWRRMGGEMDMFTDAYFRLYDDSDSTKRMAFDLGGITTGNTRTVTVPDADLTLVGTATTQTLTNKTISGASNTLSAIPQSALTGLTTSDSPQFAGVNVGHATDTTVTRGAAGVLDIEGVSALGGAEATVASATTTDIGAAKSALVSITGTTTITGFGTVAAGTRRAGRFTGALTLTHNATSLILPGGANITTAAGDRFDAVSLGSGNWVVYSYTKADGTAVVGGGGTPVDVQVFTSSNTWTKPANAKAVTVICWGGGGGGGGGCGDTTGTVRMGGAGGGGGARVERHMRADAAASSVGVTVGAGGSAGSGGSSGAGSSGGAGGDSSFGSLCFAGGGGGGKGGITNTNTVGGGGGGAVETGTTGTGTSEVAGGGNSATNSLAAGGQGGRGSANLNSNGLAEYGGGGGGGGNTSQNLSAGAGSRYGAAGGGMGGGVRADNSAVNGQAGGLSGAYARGGGGTAGTSGGAGGAGPAEGTTYLSGGGGGGGGGTNSGTGGAGGNGGAPGGGAGGGGGGTTTGGAGGTGGAGQVVVITYF